MFHTFSDCPGTQSESAGKVSACQGCPNKSICASGATKGPDLGKLFFVYTFIIYHYFIVIQIYLVLCIKSSNHIYLSIRHQPSRYGRVW